MPSVQLIPYLFSFILGSVVGSFLNVCIYRLPREQSIVSPPSHCSSCGGIIRSYHNVPILSYVFLRGKCANCNASISLTYPFVEILSGLLLLVIVWKFGISLNTIFYAVFIFSLIVITFIDIEHKIIPNIITLPGVTIGLAYNLLITIYQTMGMPESSINAFRYVFKPEYLLSLANEIPILDSMLGVILGGGVLLSIAYVYKAIRKRDGMGMGDVKLLSMIGAFVGWKGVMFTVFLSSILGALVGISILILRKGDLSYALPFGPFMSVAAIAYIFASEFSFRF